MNIQTRAASRGELRYLPAEIREIEAPHRRVSAIISTEARDRWGSVIRQNGLHWQSEDLPVLAGHDTGEPIARTTKIAPASVNGVPATMATISSGCRRLPGSRSFRPDPHGLAEFASDSDRGAPAGALAVSKAEDRRVSTAVPGNRARRFCSPAPAPAPGGPPHRVLTAPASSRRHTSGRRSWTSRRSRRTDRADAMWACPR